MYFTWLHNFTISYSRWKVTADLNEKDCSIVQWVAILKQWVHEVWVLCGNSNRLVSDNIQIQFKVLGPNIFLNTVSQVE